MTEKLEPVAVVVGRGHHTRTIDECIEKRNQHAAITIYLHVYRRDLTLTHICDCVVWTILVLSGLR